MSTWFFAFSVAALIAVVILLAWRVWRLENLVNRVRERANNSPHATEVGRWFAARDRADDDLRTDWVRTDSRLHQFARALGYEWKRTDAKEGWEKKAVNPFGFGISDYDAYKKAIERSINVPPIWVQAGPATRVGDRRKADRRKPVVREAGVAAAAEVTRLTNKSRPKKRRATH